MKKVIVLLTICGFALVYNIDNEDHLKLTSHEKTGSKSHYLQREISSDKSLAKPTLKKVNKSMQTSTSKKHEIKSLDKRYEAKLTKILTRINAQHKKADNDESVDWIRHYEDFFRLIVDDLERRHQSNKYAKEKFISYIDLIEKQAKNGKSIFDKYEKSMDRMHALYEVENRDEELYKRARAHFKRMQKQLKEMRALEQQQIVAFWGTDYKAIMRLNENYNRRMTEKNSHLSYSVGISL